MPELAVISEAAPKYRARVATTPGPGSISVVVRQSNSNPPLSDARRVKESVDSPVPVERLEDIAASAPDIWLHLARILDSPIFIQSERLSRFLRFIVEHVVAGQQSRLKEYVIGAEVYERKPPYHPSQDSIVRTEARRLRGKLKEYYETLGRDDAIRLSLRPGNYVPVFKHKDASAGAETVFGPNTPLMLSKRLSPAIAILPFQDISRSPLSSTCARGIPDELAYTLTGTKGCRVMSPASIAHLHARELEVAAVMSKAGAQIGYEGSVREEANRIRVTGRIIDAAGFQLWTRRLDFDAGSNNLFAIEGQVARALAGGFAELFGHSRHLRLT